MQATAEVDKMLKLQKLQLVHIHSQGTVSVHF